MRTSTLTNPNSIVQRFSVLTTTMVLVGYFGASALKERCGMAIIALTVLVIEAEQSRALTVFFTSFPHRSLRSPYDLALGKNNGEAGWSGSRGLTKKGGIPQVSARDRSRGSDHHGISKYRAFFDVQ